MAPYVGTWEGDTGAVPPPGANPSVTATMRLARLEVLSSGKFLLTVAGVGHGGQANLGDRGGTLQVMTSFGRPVEPYSLPVRRLDGATIELEARVGDSTIPIKLKKISSETKTPATQF